MLTGNLESRRGSPYAFPIHLKALEAMKRQDGLGESPTGQRLPDRTYGSWKEPEAIPDWKACKAYLEDSIACPSYLESWKGSEKAVWTWSSSKGQRRPGRPYDSGTDPDTNSDRVKRVGQLPGS